MTLARGFVPPSASHLPEPIMPEPIMPEPIMPEPIMPEPRQSTRQIHVLSQRPCL
jgi:hypothetical protein